MAYLGWNSIFCEQRYITFIPSFYFTLNGWTGKTSLHSYLVLHGRGVPVYKTEGWGPPSFLRSIIHKSLHLETRSFVTSKSCVSLHENQKSPACCHFILFSKTKTRLRRAPEKVFQCLNPFFSSQQRIQPMKP